MHAAPRTTAPATGLVADRSLPVPPQPAVPGETRRRPGGAIFADAIISCIAEGRQPAGHEVRAVAARIWSDLQIGSANIPWEGIVPGCSRHRRIVAVALAALRGATSDGKPP
jgi:hypothetical protein